MEEKNPSKTPNISWNDCIVHDIFLFFFLIIIFKS